MTDRELLESAAKAAGIEAIWLAGWAGMVRHYGTACPISWDPLGNDGDAFRLLCLKSLRIVEDRGGAYRAVQYTVRPEADDEEVHEVEIDWPHSTEATRRAIVRAAAALAPAA